MGYFKATQFKGNIRQARPGKPENKVWRKEDCEARVSYRERNPQVGTRKFALGRRLLKKDAKNALCFASISLCAVCFVFYSPLSRKGFLSREEGQTHCSHNRARGAHCDFLSEAVNIQPSSHGESTSLDTGRMVDRNSFRTVPGCQTGFFSRDEGKQKHQHPRTSCALEMGSPGR